MYGYEIWLEGNCIRQCDGYYTETEAEEEAYSEVLDVLYEDDEYYIKEGYTEDDFEIVIIS